MKVFKSEPIKYEAYDLEVVVYIAETFQQILEENNLPRRGHEDMTMKGFMMPWEDKCLIILRRDTPRVGVLHECIHAINDMYARIGAKIDPDNDEVYVREVSTLQDKVLDMHYEYNAKAVVRND